MSVPELHFFYRHKMQFRYARFLLIIKSHSDFGAVLSGMKSGCAQAFLKSRDVLTAALVVLTKGQEMESRRLAEAGELSNTACSILEDVTLSFPVDIRELGFRSKTPLSSVPYLRYQVRLLSGVAAEEQAKELGKIARMLKFQYSKAIVAHIPSCSILSPIPLIEINDAEIIAQQNINLVSGEYELALLEACNFHLTQAFKLAKSSPWIDFYKKRVYSSTVFPLSSSSDGASTLDDADSDIIEGQRYLNYDFSIDRDKFLMLNLDFASEYHSRKTLDELNLNDMRAGQKLIHTYDNKSCEFAGVAEHDISALLPELSNNSIIQYHQYKENLPASLLQGFDTSATAVKVIYSRNQGAKTLEASHAPQLLRKLYDRTQINSEEFDNSLWPIDEKVEQAIKTVGFLNQGGRFCLNDFPIAFEQEPLKPLNLKQVNIGDRKKNLYFGDHKEREQIKSIKVAYPSAALQKYYLLDKPAEPVKSVILYPSSLEAAARKYSDSLKAEFQLFGVEFRRAYQGYDSDSPLAMRRVCKEIKDCDVVLAFVPEQDSYADSRESDPYKVLKRQLVQRRIPSQMVTLPMLKKGWNRNVGQNLVLGINGKLGHTSWCVDSMPGDTDLFIGLDVSRKEGVTVGASSFVFNSDGHLLEWSATDFQAYQESFNSENLENLLFDLYTRKPVERLVIHRDGKLQPEEFKTLQKVEAILKRDGLVSLDVIEVLKSGFYRAAACHSDLVGTTYTNPSRGWVWEHSYDEAVILTTGDREAKVSQNSSPRPIRIRKRMGETDLLILAEQVYWLSEMQVGSTQTVRLPITTYYADRAAGFAQEKLLPSGLQNERRLWFL